jgi:hypothetical protein
MPTDAFITNMIVRKARRNLFGVDMIANNQSSRMTNYS